MYNIKTFKIVITSFNFGLSISYISGDDINLLVSLYVFSVTWSLKLLI